VRSVAIFGKVEGFADPTWEPEKNLTEVEAIDNYHERYLERPTPTRAVPVRAALMGTRA